MQHINPVFHKEIRVDQIKQAAELIKDADVIHISAGAGMGIDSGMPDFRGDDGFWRYYPQGLARYLLTTFSIFRPTMLERLNKLAKQLYLIFTISLLSYYLTGFNYNNN